uniref:DUF148 domain-containing protein n=1 Tax=Strongyloides papillosus TaxID=174720 RepID=A0A0N5C161_STREA
MQFVKYFVIISLLAIQYSFQDSSSSSSSSEEGQIELGTTEISTLPEEFPSYDVNTPRSRIANSYLLKTMESGRDRTKLLLQKAQELRERLRSNMRNNFDDNYNNRAKRLALSKVKGLAKNAAKKLTSKIGAKLLQKLL